MARWNSCNIFHPGTQSRRLWQFNASGKFDLTREEAKLPGEALPANLFSKDWQSLIKPRLNVVWLPEDHVFLRVIQIPKTSDRAELHSMIELQLEKLSPLPVAQIVWSFELLDQPMDDMQTAIVAIVARNDVEALLGKLETDGFLADRLELPLIDQLRAVTVEEDGLWIYPGLGNQGNSCMIAFWYAKILWNLTLLHLPGGENRAAVLHEQITQMTWAGELEGWMVSTPKTHVVAAPSTIEAWGLNDIDFTFQAPLPPAELAARTARRAVAANASVVNLLPSDYQSRYREKFQGKLWIQGLAAVLMLYLLVAGVYIVWVQIQDYRLDSLQKDVANAAAEYTNTVRIKEQVRVLQEQVDLQWAALECYKAVAENLPDGLSLESLVFSGGTRLNLTGTGSSNEERNKVIDFMESLRKYMSKDQPLFKSMDGPRLNIIPGQQTLSWSFTADLKPNEGS